MFLIPSEVFQDSNVYLFRNFNISGSKLFTSNTIKETVSNKKTKIEYEKDHSIGIDVSRV